MESNKIPNHKFQIPNKHQAPMTQTKKKNPQCFCFGHWNLEIGAKRIWDLVLGIWKFLTGGADERTDLCHRRGSFHRVP
jgi:hypothetical protein